MASDDRTRRVSGLVRQLASGGSASTDLDLTEEFRARARALAALVDAEPTVSDACRSAAADLVEFDRYIEP